MLDSNASPKLEAPDNVGSTDFALYTVFANATPFRIFALKLVRSPVFTGVMMMVVLLNIIQMSLLSTTNLDVSYGIYTMETLLRIYGWRRLFLSSGWYMFDLMLVLFNFLDWIRFAGAVAPFPDISFVQLASFFHFFRVIRPLRILRSVAFFYNLQLIVSTLMRSIPAMGALAALLIIVMSTSLFEVDSPDRYGSIGSSFMSCFQLLTLDDAFTFFDDIAPSNPVIGVFLVISILLNNLQEMQGHYNAVVKNANKKQVTEVRKVSDLNTDKKRKAESEAKYRKILEEYGKELITTSDREKILLLQYFMCMASLEQEAHTFHNQKEVLDNLVDRLAQQE